MESEKYSSLNPKVFFGPDQEKIFGLIQKYNLYPPAVLQKMIVDLQGLIALETVFQDLPPSTQMQIYRFTELMGLQEIAAQIGIHPDDFSYDPSQTGVISSAIHRKYSRGYPVKLGGTWSKLRTPLFQELRDWEELGLPVRKAEVLFLCGGYGFLLQQARPIYSDSHLVLVDANPENIRQAMTYLSDTSDSNRVTINLADARAGFDGIGYPDNTFDTIYLLGKSDFGMGIDDLERLLIEIIRTIKKGAGQLLVETDVISYYIKVLKLMKEKGELKYRPSIHQIGGNDDDDYGLFIIKFTKEK